MEVLLSKLYSFPSSPKYIKCSKAKYRIGYMELWIDSVYSNTLYIPYYAVPKYMLVTRACFAPYIIMCSIFGEPLDPSIFEFWINPDTRIVLSNTKVTREGLVICRKMLENSGIPEVWMEGGRIDTLLYPNLSEFSSRYLDNAITELEDKVFDEMIADAIVRIPPLVTAC